VMGNRLIALNFMFVGCSTICPIQSQLLAQTQKLVAGRMGREIAFVSVTLSPLSDTPDKLVRFANAHDAGPGWHFVAGDFSATSRLRQGFDAYAPRQEDHPPVLFIGRVGDAQWTRLYGMPRPTQIARELNARIA
jgi:protein SCO1